MQAYLRVAAMAFGLATIEHTGYDPSPAPRCVPVSPQWQYNPITQSCEYCPPGYVCVHQHPAAPYYAYKLGEPLPEAPTAAPKHTRGARAADMLPTAPPPLETALNAASGHNRQAGRHIKAARGGNPAEIAAALAEIDQVRSDLMDASRNTIGHD